MIAMRKFKGTCAAAALAGALTLASGCTTTHGDFTVLSNKLVNLKEFDLSQSPVGHGVEGVDDAHIILFIPTGHPTLEAAIDDMLQKGQGDVATDATVRSTFWWIPFIYGYSSWSVTGDVVRTRRS